MKSSNIIKHFWWNMFSRW